MTSMRRELQVPSLGLSGVESSISDAVGRVFGLEVVDVEAASLTNSLVAERAFGAA
jgi:hypothetical protein